MCTSDETSDPRAAQFEVTWRVCRATRDLVEKQRGLYTDDNYPNRAAHLWGTTIRKR